MRNVRKWALVAAVGLAPAGANATTHDFDFSTADSVFTATGSITTANTLDALGGYDILSMSGTLSGPGGGAITLVPNPSQPFPTSTANFGYDNVFFPGAAEEIDLTGILFSAGGYDYNLYSYSGTYYLSSDNPVGVYVLGEPITFRDPIQTAANAPEPSTWAMMLLGFVGLGLAARRQARKRNLALGAPAIALAQKA